MELEPTQASKLAEEVYTVQSDAMLELFLKRPEFSTKVRSKSVLKAEVGSRLVSTEDAFAVCALGGEQRSNELFLVFRGSTSANFGADWVNNARVGLERGETGSLVHIGFNHIFNSLRPQLKAFLDRHAHVSGPIHCIGHSLGGAVASLVADWVRSWRPNPVKLYTFGSPRVGLEGFARQLTNRLQTRNAYRVYHKTDPVSMIPVFPFIHAPLGEGFLIPYGYGVLSFAAHRVGNYVDSCRHCSWLALKARPNPALGERALERWLASDQPDNAADPGIWDRVNAALIWVLGKLSAAFLAPIQVAFMGTLTLADKIALALRRGIDFSKEVGFWVYRLIRRITQLLGIAIANTTTDLTRELMRWVMARLIDRMTQQAQRAVRHLSGQ